MVPVYACYGCGNVDVPLKVVTDDIGYCAKCRPSLFPADPVPARDYDVVGAMIAYEMNELDSEEIIELFQHLIDSGLAWSLQGSYGRVAEKLLELGLCTRPARS